MADGRPNLLVAINGNAGEWREAMTPSAARPRLPLPGVMGAAFVRSGFALRAVDEALAGDPDPAPPAVPFERIFAAHQFGAAVRSADHALLWGRSGLRALASQAVLRGRRGNIAYLSYSWNGRRMQSLSRSAKETIAGALGRFAGAVVLMTGEQFDHARRHLPRHVAALRLTVGIDTRFYRRPVSLGDLAEDSLPFEDRRRLGQVLDAPYVVMPGDELRLNDHALAVVENTGLRLVRISQYGHRNSLIRLKEEVCRKGLEDRLFVFERVSYPVLRYLMRKASAYAGLVDSTWQPAGWTVACECLASGIPVVLYEGLTSRELQALGAAPDYCRAVPMGDAAAFGDALLAAAGARGESAAEAAEFARRKLDLDRTGAEFVDRFAEFAARKSRVAQ